MGNRSGHLGGRRLTYISLSSVSSGCTEYQAEYPSLGLSCRHITGCNMEGEQAGDEDGVFPERTQDETTVTQDGNDATQGDSRPRVHSFRTPSYERAVHGGQEEEDENTENSGINVPQQTTLDITFSRLTYSSVTLTVLGADNFILQYRKSGTVEWWEVQHTGSSNVRLQNLEPDVTYRVRAARRREGDTGENIYSEEASFRTLSNDRLGVVHLQYSPSRSRPVSYRLCLDYISKNLTKEDFQRLKFVCKPHLHLAEYERVTNGRELFAELDRKGVISEDNVCELKTTCRDLRLTVPLGTLKRYERDWGLSVATDAADLTTDAEPELLPEELAEREDAAEGVVPLPAVENEPPVVPVVPPAAPVPVDPQPVPSAPTVLGVVLLSFLSAVVVVCSVFLIGRFLPEEERLRSVLGVPRGIGIPFSEVPYPTPYFTGHEDYLSKLQLEHDRFSSRWYGPMKSHTLVQVLTGLPGYGKTEIAIQYALQSYHQGRFRGGIFWLTCSSRQRLNVGLEKMMANIGLSLELKDYTHENILRVVTKWLWTNHNWMLVLNGVRSPDLVREYFPSLPKGGHIIIASDYTDWKRVWDGTVTAVYDVTGLNQSEAELFLIRRRWDLTLLEAASKRTELKGSKSEEYQALQTLVGKDGFDGLPLALEKAGAYMRYNKYSFTRYLELYRRKTTGLLGEEHGDLPINVKSSMLLSAEKVQKDHPAAIQLLEICSLLDLAIPEWIFVRAAVNLTDSRLRDELLGGENSSSVSEIEISDNLNTILMRLERYSLIKRHQGEETGEMLVEEDEDIQREKMYFTIPRLLQTVVRSDLKEKPQKMTLALSNGIRILKAIFPNATSVSLGMFVSFNDRDKHIKYNSIVTNTLIVGQTVSEVVRKFPRKKTSTADTETCSRKEDCLQQIEDPTPLFNAVGMYLRRDGQSEQALEIFQLAVRATEALNREDKYQLAIAKRYLGKAYFELLELDKSEQEFKESLRLIRELYPQDHVEVACGIQAVARARQRRNLTEMGEDYVTETERMLQTALRLKKAFYEKRNISNHYMIAVAYNNLGALYQDLGRLEESEQLIKASLKMKRTVFGEEHISVAIVLNKLARNYLLGDHRNLTEAARLTKMSLELKKKVLPQRHRACQLALYFLVRIYKEMGQEATAGEYLKELMEYDQNNEFVQKLEDNTSNFYELYPHDWTVWL
ncbi:uncharacterized protein [Branchiostoma lanceolatum]|uniref:uncharacterized protein n=1 Tax=Branchiostoma lanceolatum TaxID=7740 RepID=UPI003454776D